MTKPSSFKAPHEICRGSLEAGEIPHPDPNDPSLFPQCYTNGYLIISKEAWARGVRIDDLCEGMPAAIYWNGSYGEDVERGTPATVEVIRRTKKSGRILEVVVRREDGAPRQLTYTDPNFIAWISADHEEDPLAVGPMPKTCLKFQCTGAVAASDGFMKCMACGVSYGAVHAYSSDVQEPAAQITFTMRSYGTLLCKGTYGRSVMRLVIGTMFVEPETTTRSADLPY